MPPTASAADETSVSAGPASSEAGSNSSAAALAAGLEELQRRMGLRGFLERRLEDLTEGDPEPE
eukprot:454808-Rhodomonas_salina.1